MTDFSLVEAIRQGVAELEALITHSDECKAAEEEARARTEAARQAVLDHSLLLGHLFEAANRYGGPEVLAQFKELPAVETNDHIWQSMTRTEAIVLALKRVGVPLSPKNLTAYLQSHGRHQDSAGAVSATLGHLAESGRVKTVGRGQWTVGPNASVIDRMADDTHARLSGGLHFPPDFDFGTALAGGLQPEAMTQTVLDALGHEVNGESD